MRKREEGGKEGREGKREGAKERGEEGGREGLLELYHIPIILISQTGKYVLPKSSQAVS